MKLGYQNAKMSIPNMLENWYNVLTLFDSNNFFISFYLCIFAVFNRLN